MGTDLNRAVTNSTREIMNWRFPQLRRAASSVPANIAEGANRSSKKEYLQFLSVASGSLAEARYFLHLSRRLGYVGDGDYSKASKLAEETSKTLSGLIHALKGEV